MIAVKRGFTLVEFIVVAAILLTIVSLLWPAVSASRAAAKRSNDGVVERATPQPPGSWNLYTVQHDGHWFVKDTGGGVCHHPDCPCLSRKAENEAN